MAITAVNESALVQPDKAVGSKDLERSDFMTLFITQLQHQDPMEPMDSYEMASQLAQFSNMEATMKMSDNMEKLLEYQTSQNNLQILSLLNTEVQISGSLIGVVEGEASATEFNLVAPAEKVHVEIYDTADHLVWQQDMGSLPQGTYELDWDSVDALGEKVVDAPYRYQVKAYGLTGEEVEVEYRSTGKVTGVRFDDGVAHLTIDDYVEAGVDEIIKVQ